MQEKVDKAQAELDAGTGELVRSSVMVKSKKGGEESKDGSSAVLMKSRLGEEDVKLEDFKIQKVLDKGSFGKVFLVVNKNSG